MLSLAHVTLMTFINSLPASPLCVPYAPAIKELPSLTASFPSMFSSFLSPCIPFFTYLFYVHKLSTLGTILSLEGLGDMKIKILGELMVGYSTLSS